MPGLFTLRTLDDCLALADLVGRPGCRVWSSAPASSVRARGDLPPAPARYGFGRAGPASRFLAGGPPCSAALASLDPNLGAQ